MQVSAAPKFQACVGCGGGFGSACALLEFRLRLGFRPFLGFRLRLGFRPFLGFRDPGTAWSFVKFRQVSFPSGGVQKRKKGFCQVGLLAIF